MNKFALAASAALVLTATSASANGYWQDGVYYSTPSVTTNAYSTRTYTTPSYVAPSTYTTPSYVAPSYVAPSHTPPTYTYAQPTVTTPAYQAPTYTQPTYVAPSTVYAPAPNYILPQYDAKDRVRQRIGNQRNRIERARDRGDLRPREEDRLRNGLRDIRQTFRAYRSIDGVIGRYEEAELMRMLDRNSRRIARLANNSRTVRYDDRYYRPYAR